MSDDRDIFDRPLGNRPAHMNTFLRLNEPKTIQQLAQESGYTNVEGHIGALRKEGKVVNAGRGKGYVINNEWFNRQSEAARRKFLASCGLRDRERWFQVVMGQKFEFDESMSEEIDCRIPLVPKLAESLTFDLARWKRSSLNPVPS